PAYNVIYTLSLHDALPILLDVNTQEIVGHDLGYSVIMTCAKLIISNEVEGVGVQTNVRIAPDEIPVVQYGGSSAVIAVEFQILIDRKSTRLNSSHVKISYA